MCGGRNWQIVAVVQDRFNHCREGNKGCIEFVTSMAIILLKMKYDHGSVFVFCALKDS